MSAQEPAERAAPPVTITTRTVEETLALGAALGGHLSCGCLVLLNGGLGAGKTSLVQGICAGLGVTDTVTSPGFTLCQEYVGRIPVLHYDLYRIDGEDTFWEIGLYDALRREALVLVEWGNKARALAALADLVVAIEHLDDGRRFRFHARHHCEGVAQALEPYLDR
jgi:tRNA threonylcarbamoyladenosine biosynthesis protein TsaE